MRGTLPIAWCLLATLVLGGCTTRDVTGPQTKNVAATDNQFTPNTLSLTQNDKIHVANQGSNLHSVTIHMVGDPATTTKKDTDIPAGTATDYTFDQPGTFHVYCKYHSAGSTGSFSTGMVLTVTVKANS